MESQKPQAADAPRAPTPRPGQTFGLTLGGESLSLPLPGAGGPVSLAQLVAPARTICDRLVEALEQQAVRLNRSIPCRKGCSACCHYLVPLSVPEALLLPTELAALPPAQAARMQARLLAAGRKMLQAGPPPDDDALDPADAARTLSDWNAAAGLACPFLSDHCCRLYAHRPLSCREHLVQSPSRQCASALPGHGSPAGWGISVSTALADLTAELERLPAEAVFLPMALPWFQSNRHRNEATYPADLALGRLAELLESQALAAAA